MTCFRLFLILLVLFRFSFFNFYFFNFPFFIFHFSFSFFLIFLIGYIPKGAQMGMGDGVTSIAWSGSSLLLSRRSGAVSFLLPFPSIHSLTSLHPSTSLQSNENYKNNGNGNENGNDYHHSMIQSLGFRIDRTDANSTDNRSLSYGLLCSLPRHLTSSGRSARMRNTEHFLFLSALLFTCVASIDFILYYSVKFCSIFNIIL